MDGMKTHAILLFSTALALGGCATDDARLRELDEALREAVRDAWAKAATSGEAATPASADAAPFASLKWPWGGFDGSKAALSDKARIKALKVTASGLSYAWESGGCEDLGASSRTDASCLACLFCFDGSAWRGGKFDWISTSRTSRDLKNIESGYSGWDAAAFRSAKAHAFCIVSKDGRRRTNVIVQEGGLK